MSEEQLKAFLEAIKADAGLQEKLKAAADADAVVAIAKTAGFVISTEELQRVQSEISQQELEGVAGGMVPSVEELTARLRAARWDLIVPAPTIRF